MTRWTQSKRRMLYRRDLPLVGPFEFLKGSRTSNLPSFVSRVQFSSITAQKSLIGMESRPRAFDNFYLQDNHRLSSVYKIDFLWANKAVIDGEYYFAGEGGYFTSEGGTGGGGGSGGGAGGYFLDIGNGGSDGNDGDSTAASDGGVGLLASFGSFTAIAPITYNYKLTGGAGGDGGQGSYYYEGLAGATTTVVGAGGGGGGSGGSGDELGAGGGGGGGFFCGVFNDLSGKGFFNCNGGDGGEDDALGNSGGGGGGGGGCCWIAARKYSGTLLATVEGGTGGSSPYASGGSGKLGEAQIYEIKKDGTLVPRLFTDSWNNL